MSVTVSPITLINNETGVPVEGEIWDKITEQQLDDWEKQWIPALATGLKRLQTANTHASKWPQASTLDWRQKMDAVKSATLAHPSVSIMCDGKTQGLMILNTFNQGCQVESQRGKNLAYIELIEVAPWNRKEFHQTPRYRGIGRLLIGAAIQLSREEGFKGRIGLHSLQSAEGFYMNKCGMTDRGTDVNKGGLRYFEATQEQAAAFLRKGNQP